MPNWKSVLDEIKKTGSPHDVVRRKYLANLSEYTKRNTIIYYSGWLQKRELGRMGVSFSIDDSDKNGFMTAIHNLDRTKGLDLILHTPGGEMAATESLVYYLKKMYKNDIRVIVPQLAMSAGTIIALASKEIVMGEHSSLGPIDPQIGGIPAHGIIEEFKQAQTDVAQNPTNAAVWQPIIAKYSPTLIGESQKAIQWSEAMVKKWLIEGMFHGEADADAKADHVVNELGDHSIQKSHSRHISKDGAVQLGLKIVSLEDDHVLQEKVLSVHHATIHTLTDTPATKIIENHEGSAFILQAKTMMVQQ